MKTRLRAAVLLATLSFPLVPAPLAPALGQTTGGTPPPTASTIGSGRLSRSDKGFLMREGAGAAYELALCQLAAQRAVRDDVKAYAQRVAQDHAQLNPELRRLAQSKGVALPTELRAPDQRRLERLGGYQGTRFDTAYVREVRRINRADRRSFERQAQRSQDDAIRTYVQRVAAVDAQHEQAAEALATR